MQSPIRACHVVNSVGPSSGPANHATALAKHTRVESGILAWFDAEPFDGDEHVTVRCLDAPNTTLGIDRRTYREARDFLSEYDVVHAHHPHSGTFAKLIGYMLGTGIVSTEGSDHGKFTRKGRIANGLTNAIADRVTCVSETVFDSFSSWERLLLGPDAVEVIYTGVDVGKIDRSRSVDWDVREYCDIDAGTVLVGTAGRLGEPKAHDTLIQAIGTVNEMSDRDFALVIAGDGHLRPYLEGIVDDEGLEDRVHFLGLIERQRVYAMMRGLDIYAMPSRWEGFCSAVLEAMALSVPCVLSDIPSFNETFRSVARFHAVDDPADLASGLVELADDPDARRALARRGHDLVTSEYTMRDTAEAYAALYADVLGR